MACAIVVACAAGSLVLPAGARAAADSNCLITQDRSTSGTQLAKIGFSNQSGVTVDIYWLDYGGARALYAELAPDQGYVQSTWFTHPWVAIDKATGACLGYTIADVATKDYVVMPPSPGDPRGLIYFAGSRFTPTGFDPFPQLLSMAPDGANQTRFATSVSADQNPTSSPDGTRVAFDRFDGEVAQIWMKNADGTEIQLTSNGANSSNPTWSPDGKQIAFQASPFGGRSQIDAVNADGTGLIRTIAFDEASDLTNPAWSPPEITSTSGSVQPITFASCNTTSGCSLAQAPASGGGAITSLGLGGTQPAISPGGTQLAYVGSNSHIWVANTDGTGATDVTSDGLLDSSPSWSPDGAQITYAARLPLGGPPDIFVHASSPSFAPAVQLTTGTGNNDQPSWAVATSRADLGANLECSTPCPGTVGSQITFTGNVRNYGGDAAVGARAVIGVSATNGSFSADAVSIGEVSCPISEDAANCPLGTIASGDSVSVVVKATQTSVSEFPGTLHVTLRARVKTLDGALGNNDITADATIGPAASVSGVSVTVKPATAGPGASVIPAANIDLSGLPSSAGSTASAPIASIPIASIPIASIPIASIPIASIGLTPALLDSVGGVPLASLPLNTPGGWPARLAGTPLANAILQTVTLADVLRQAPAAVTGLTLKDLQLQSSPIASIPIASIALGALPLARLPLLGRTGDQNLDDWCAALNTAGFPCSGRAQVSSSTVLSIGIQGAPIASIPIASIPIASIPIASIPIASIPIASIAPAGSPIASIPIASIVVAGSPIASIPIASIPIASIGNVIDCSGLYCQMNPTKTLAEALSDGRIQPGAKLFDLGNAILSSITLEELAQFLPANITLGEVLAELAGPPGGRGYEQLPFTELPAQDWASVGDNAIYHVSFTISGGLSPTGATVQLTPPPGFRYAGGAALVHFVEGGSTSSPVAAPTQLGGKITFRVSGVLVGDPYRLDLRLSPSLLLGDNGPTAATVTPDGPGTGGSDPGADAHLVVRDPAEPANNDPASAPTVAADTIYLSYITTATDLDTFKFPAPPAGSRVTVKLVPPAGADYDLALYRPTRSSVVSSPIASIPLDGQPVSDAGVPVTHAASSQAPETLADVPIASIPIASISDNRGAAEEIATVVSQPGDAGNNLRIDVSGYQGSTSAKPYTLLVTVTPPPNLATCGPSPIASNGLPALGTLPLPTATPTGLNTLFVVDTARLTAAYGVAKAQQALTSLTTLAGRGDLGVVGSVVDVANDPTVRSAETAWNANPCLPDNANAVARAISSVIAPFRAARSSLKYVVLAGGDDQIPFFRLPDLTTVSNETDYASTFLDQGNQYFGTFASGDVLSDNPYGTTNPTPFLDRYLYIPTLSVGRLVETPDDIVKAVNQFVSSNGTLAPSTALVTGYDFLADGSQQVASTETAQRGAANVKSLIDDPSTGSTSPPWSASTLDTDLGTSPPKVLSLNAHYDHYRLLPSDRGTLFTATQMAAKTLTGRFVFTMGCHAGLSVSDAILVGASDPRRLDWAQVYGAGGAEFAGNTGFGYGDTTGVAYSEKLMSLLAKRLDGSMTAGDALTFAKNDFKASLGPVDVFDEKVLSEATYYGLPMYRVGAAAALPPTPAPRPTTPDPTIGGAVVSASLAVTPTLIAKTSPYGSYYLSDDTASVSYRPVEPSTSTDVTEPGLLAHGAVITQLASTDFPNFDAAFAMPTIDRSVLAPEPVFADSVFPTKIQTIQTYADPRGQRQRLVLVVGQFASDPQLAAGRGRQRNFTSLAARVYYAPAAVADFTPAQFGLVQGAQIGQQAAFSVRASDTGGTGVKRVLVAYHDGNQWKFIDLQPTGSDPTLWTGGGQTATTDPEFFVQAVDGAGNVSVTSYKGRYYLAPPAPTPPAGVEVRLAGTPGDRGWFKSDVTATITAPAGSTIDLDGGPANLTSPVTVAGDGIHFLSIRVGNDVTKVPVPIDATRPTIVVLPADGSTPTFNDGTRLHFSCADAGSGIFTCSAKLNGNPIADGTDVATSVGPKTVTVTAVDAAGNTTTKTVTFQVQWAFDGFLLPVKNPPTVNTVIPGNIIPVRFRLGGNQGLSIFAPGYPSSAAIACPSGAPTWRILETISPQGPSLLIYLPLIQNYVYIWKTPTAWPIGTCRTLTMKLVDGTVHTAIFKARRDD